MSKPMIPREDLPGQSPTPSPNDHARTLVELLKHAGPDLVRRWVAALLLASIDDRESIVDAVEQRMIDLYTATTGSDDDVIGLDIPDIVVQKKGFTEHTVRTYEKVEEPEPDEGEAGAAKGA